MNIYIYYKTDVYIPYILYYYDLYYKENILQYSHHNKCDIKYNMLQSMYKIDLKTLLVLYYSYYT